MEAEGMVHALELVHRLLIPGGVLVDIHPSGDPPPVEIVLGQQTHLVGHMQESDDFVEYAQARAALAQAVQGGYYFVERQGHFDFLNHADTLEELHRYLIEQWSDAVFPDEIFQNAERLYTQTGKKETRATLREIAVITRFRRLENPTSSQL